MKKKLQERLIVIRIVSNENLLSHLGRDNSEMVLFCQETGE